MRRRSASNIQDKNPRSNRGTDAKMGKDILATMRETFYSVQFNRTCHKNHQTKLQKLYSRGDFEEFSRSFITCLKTPLTHGEKHIHIENILEFAAQFAVSLYNGKEGDEEQMCPFLLVLFDFLLEHHNAVDQSVRFRVCHFLNLILNSMGDQAFIDDSLCDKITLCMMERVMDKSSKVRAQAIFALQRLQDPTDDDCPVIKMFVFHLSKDPNKDVRKAVLSCMGKNIKALQAALKRTRDVNESVRKMAYIFISKITVRSLTIKQREQLLNDGLKDRANVVSETVRSVLLPSWMQHFGGEYAKLLRALDAENATETAVLALNALLKRADLAELMKQLPVEVESSLIPIEKLTSESVLYWRCLVQHLYRESCTEHIELCLPELTKFCDYIREYLGLMEAGNKESGDKVSQDFILRQLFEIAKTYDLADESGRTKLMDLILDALLSDHCSVKTTEFIVEYFEKVVPDVESRLTSLTHAISEIKMPTRHDVPTQMIVGDEERLRYEKAELHVKLIELQDEEYTMIQQRNFLGAQALKEEIEGLVKKIDEISNRNKVLVSDVTKERNDPEAMNRCLTITCCMAAAQSVTTLTPTLRSLLEDLAIPSLNHSDDSVQILALKAVAILSRLDKGEAKKNIMLYFCQLSLPENSREVTIVSLQAMFDLLLHYGLEFFDIAQDPADDVAEVSERRRSKTVKLYSSQQQDDVTSVSLPSHKNADGSIHFVKMLTSLLDDPDQEMRTIATEGLCKLILHRRIKGAHLISRLVIQFYNPITEDDLYLRQCLCTFFKTYVCRVPDSQETIESAFLPTLKILANAPVESPLMNIEPYHVANYLISMTSCRNHKPGHESYTVHNNLAETILTELCDSSSKIPRISLLKSLAYLDVKFDDNARTTDLRAAADRIVESLSESERRLAKYLTQFKKKLVSAEETRQEESRQEESRQEIQPNSVVDLTVVSSRTSANGL